MISVDKHWQVDLRYVIAYLVIVAIIYLIPLLTIKRSLSKQVDKLLYNSLNRNSFSDHTVSFSETGFTIKSKTIESLLKWEAVVKLSETQDYFYLFMSSSEAIQIPKRAFPSEAEIEPFRKFLMQYLSFVADISTRPKP